MKSYINSILFILGLCAFLFANSTAEYNKAQETLRERGEVYFKFYVNSPADLKEHNLFNVVSIDHIDHNEIHAYANRDEFQRFTQCNLYYEVLTPQSLLVQVEMSDSYDNPETGSRFDFYRYPTYDAYMEQMKSWVTQFPELCHLDTLGFTKDNRHAILLLRVESDIDKQMENRNFCGPPLYTVTKYLII